MQISLDTTRKTMEKNELKAENSQFKVILAYCLKRNLVLYFFALCPRLQLTGRRGGRGEGRLPEQWECGEGIVGENLGWSHSVWSAPPLPSSSFCSAAKAISTSY